MKKTIGLLILVLVILLVVSGCGIANNTASDSDSKPKQEASKETQKEEPNAGETVAKQGPGVKSDTGTYVGQIDGNSIEIKISGVPDGLSNKAFRLSDEVKAKFDSLKLKTGDQVFFNYSINKDNQNVMVELGKINN